MIAKDNSADDCPRLMDLSNEKTTQSDVTDHISNGTVTADNAKQC